jgi:hypothetical protein
MVGFSVTCTATNDPPALYLRLFILLCVPLPPEVRKLTTWLSLSRVNRSIHSSSNAYTILFILCTSLATAMALLFAVPDHDRVLRRRR